MGSEYQTVTMRPGKAFGDDVAFTRRCFRSWRNFMPSSALIGLRVFGCLQSSSGRITVPFQLSFTFAQAVPVRGSCQKFGVLDLCGYAPYLVERPTFREPRSPGDLTTAPAFRSSNPVDAPGSSGSLVLRVGVLCRPSASRCMRGSLPREDRARSRMLLILSSSRILLSSPSLPAKL